MKIFKKISLILTAVVCVFLMTACGGEKNVEGTLEELMAKVYAEIPEDKRPMMLANTEVTDENVEWYLGDTGIEYESALGSESGVGSIAHSVVLVRTKDNADVEGIKTKIKEKINPRKWVCVGVEEEDVIVESKGNLIILILVEDEDTRNTLKEAFNNL